MRTLAFTALVLLGFLTPSDARTWKSATAKFTVEAEFVELDGLNVVLANAAGERLRVPLSKLHVDDQRYVMDLTGWGRIWESSTGKRVIADLVKSKDGRATIERLDGRQFTVSVETFSKADQAYIQSRESGDYERQFKAGDIFFGKVVGLADGDTLTVLYGRQRVKVRLHGIDAPETGQAFSRKSKQSLSRLVFGKRVKVDVVDRDKYGRVVGVVTIERESANEHQLAEGLAWHSTKYSDNRVYQSLEDEAKDQQRGLWSESGPVAPWDWRRWGPADRKKWLGRQQATPSFPERVESRKPTSLSHWITINSRKRHNASCRWFQNSKGRMCGPNDGIACKICGG